MGDPCQKSNPLAEMLFSSMQFESAIIHTSDPTLKIRCAIELLRFEQAIVIADEALALGEDPEILALKTLARESVSKLPKEEIERCYRYAAERGSDTAIIGLAKHAIVAGEHRRVLEIVRPLYEDKQRRSHYLGTLVTMQSLTFIESEIPRARRMAHDIEHGLQSRTTYDAVFGLLFLVKHHFKLGAKREAKRYMSVLDVILRDAPVCRFHGAYNSLDVALTVCQELKLGVTGEIPAHAYARRPIGLPLSITRKPTLAAVFSALAAAGHRGLDKEGLAIAVWGIDYSPERHDARIYKSITRLKKEVSSTGWAFASIGDRWFLSAPSTDIPETAAAN